MTMVQKMEEEEINHLERLPPDLLILVLQKVRDARFLNRTLAVSKMFAPLLRWVTDVSIPCFWRSNMNNYGFMLWEVIPPLRYDGNDDYQMPRCYMIKLGFISRYLDIQYTAFLFDRSFSSSSGSENRHNYEVDCTAPNRHLKGFESIRSLRINLTHTDWTANWMNESRDHDMAKYFKLVELGGATELIKSCIVLHADHGLYQSPQSAAPEVRMSDSSRGDLEEKVFACTFQTIEILSRAVPVHFTIQHIILNNQTVKDVVMVDALRGTWFHAGEDAVTDLRTRAAADRPNLFQRLRDFCFKLWHVPELSLRRSGRELRGVTIAILMSRDLASRQSQRSAVGGGDPTIDYGEFLRSHFDRTHQEGPDGCGEFLRSYFNCDEVRDGSQGTPFFIREAVWEMARLIGHLPCYSERNL